MKLTDLKIPRVSFKINGGRSGKVGRPGGRSGKKGGHGFKISFILSYLKYCINSQ